jgi:hypothetical protein
LYRCEAWFLTLREQHRLRKFGKRVLRRIFWPRRKWLEAGEDCIMRSFVTCMLHQNIIRVMGRTCSTHGRYEKCI